MHMGLQIDYLSLSNKLEELRKQVNSVGERWLRLIVVAETVDGLFRE